MPKGLQKDIKYAIILIMNVRQQAERAVNRAAVTASVGSVDNSPYPTIELMDRGTNCALALVAGRAVAYFFGNQINGKLANSLRAIGPEYAGVSDTPSGHGWEAVVFPVVEDGRVVRRAKIYLPKIGEPAQQTAEKMIRNIEEYRCLGSIALPTSVHLAPSPFARRQELVVVGQNNVQGTCLVRGKNKPSPEALGNFNRKVREMLNETGTIPDLIGPGNVLVSEDGETITLVDQGAPLGEERSDFKTNVAFLESLEMELELDELMADSI